MLEGWLKNSESHSLGYELIIKKECAEISDFY